MACIQVYLEVLLRTLKANAQQIGHAENFEKSWPEALGLSAAACAALPGIAPKPASRIEPAQEQTTRASLTILNKGNGCVIVQWKGNYQCSGKKGKVFPNVLRR